MKKYLTLTLLLLNTLTCISQDRYVIFFTDKNNSPYSLANPLQFLSQRAIDRRIQQGIAIDQSDLPVNPQYVQAMVNAGATILNTTRWFNAAIVDIPSSAVLTAIAQLPFVQSTFDVGKPLKSFKNQEHKFETLAPLATQRMDQMASSNGTNNFNYGFSANQVNMIGLNNLHNMGYTGEGMLIAVLDAGFLDVPFMTCFDSIRLNNQIVATWDFVDRENDVYDDNSHGSSVLSCMASNKPDTLMGTAPHADYLLLRSEDAGSEYLIEEYNWSVAAEFADSAGADIINSSLGYTLFDDPFQNHAYTTMNGDINPVTRAADFAASRGIIVVNSAGNEGNSPWNYISAPADADSILAVGAVDFTGSYASFSGNGPTADGRVKPDVSAMGQGTWLFSPFSGNQAVSGNGTSFSSPVIAGAVACLWQAWGTKSSMEVIQAVKRSGSIFSSPDTTIGHGIPNFSMAYSLLGFGEISLPDQLSLHLFPNPVTEGNIPAALFKAKNNGSVELSIYDFSGRLIYRESRDAVAGMLYKWEMPSTTEKGCYLISINDGNELLSGKLVRL